MFNEIFLLKKANCNINKQFLKCYLHNSTIKLKKQFLMIIDNFLNSSVQRTNF